MVDSNPDNRNIRAWQKDVASSIADDANLSARGPPPAPSNAPPPFVVNHIVTNPPVVVTRVRAPEPNTSDEISTKAIIGTVVGATAGAFIAYAMVKGDSENHQQPRSQERITYRTIEAPTEYGLGQPQSTTRVPSQDAHSRYDPHDDGARRARNLTIGPPPPRTETFIQSSARPHHLDHPRIYHAGSQRGGPIVMVDNDTQSRASSGRNTVKQEDLARLPPSAPVTEVRLARDVPLPVHSQASRYSQATSITVKDKANTKAAIIKSEENLLPSVAPHDSISQVSTRISKDSGRSKRRHSSHHGRSKTGGPKNGNDHEGKGSSKTGSKHHSKMGDMVEDVVSIIKGTSIKDGEHRSRH